MSEWSGIALDEGELAQLIRESAPGFPVHATWGTGRLLGPDWALKRICEMRGVEVPEHLADVAMPEPWGEEIGKEVAT